MAEPIVLTCKDCGYTNEPQRIYCHNCGAKLDRAALPQDNTRKESHSHLQKRVRKVVSPHRGFFSGWKHSLSSTLFWSLLCAGLIQIARPPSDIPAPLKEEEKGQYINFQDVLFNAARTPTSQKVSFKEEDANRFLANTVKGKTAGMAGDQLKFVRCFVQFDDGIVKVSTHQTIFDYPIYASVWYSLQIKDGTLDPTCAGGTIGRLKIHPVIMDWADYFLKPLWEVLKTERRGLARMKEIEVKKGEMIITTPAVPLQGAPAPIPPTHSPLDAPAHTSIFLPTIKPLAVSPPGTPGPASRGV